MLDTKHSIHAVLEYCGGGSLQRYLQGRPHSSGLPEREAASIMLQAGSISPHLPYLPLISPYLPYLPISPRISHASSATSRPSQDHPKPPLTPRYTPVGYLTVFGRSTAFPTLLHPSI